MPDTTHIRTKDLKRVVQMAAAKGGKSDLQRKSLNHARAQVKRRGESVFESPMAQGHGNSVEDYRQVGAKAPLWRVENPRPQPINRLER